MGMPKAKKTKVDGAQPSKNPGGRPRKALAENLPDLAVEEPAEAACAPVPAAEQEVLCTERTPTPPPAEPPLITVPKLRLNAPRPPVKPPAILSEQDVMRRAHILSEEHNDACNCEQLGAPAPGDKDFVEHSFLCQLHVCYAREVGCCEADFRREYDGREYAHNPPCDCLDGAFPPGRKRRVASFGPLRRRERFRVERNEPSEWPYVEEHRCGKVCGDVCESLAGICACECRAPGRYVPMCPYRLNAVTGERRGDEVARARGHAIYEDRERFGGPSVPSLPASPTWKESRMRPDWPLAAMKNRCECMTR